MDEVRVLTEDGLGPLLHHAFEGVGLAAPDPWRLVYANPLLENWLGWSPGDLRERPLSEVFDETSQTAMLAQIDQQWRGRSLGRPFSAEVRTGDSRRHPVQVRLCRVVLHEAPLLGMLFGDSIERLAPIINHPQRHDPLTGLPDREFLMSRIARLLRGERSGDQQFAALFVDLDNFKQVNDEHGHLIGDSVLREAARRLVSCVREGDHIVRYGGDEFVVLVERVTGPREIEPIITRIQAAMARPIALPEGQVTLSLSVGVAMASAEFRSPEEMLAAADRAMYATRHPRA